MFGPLPLLQRTVSGIVPRPLDEISTILTTAAKGRIDFSSRYRRLRVLADSLNKDDWTKAAVVFAHLRLPETLDELFAKRLETAELLWKANFNPDEPRDDKGRWTTEGNRENSSDASGSIVNVLGIDCVQVLAACRVECTDAYVAGDFKDIFSMRQCIRACMHRNGCFDF
jgi:hypothetical protein